MTTKDEFVHLHVHTHGSMLDGFGTVDEYLDAIQSQGGKALGISDHGNTHYAYDLVTKANKRDMTGIPGCEFYMAPENPEGARVKRPVYYGPNGEKVHGKDVSGDGAFTHITVWAYNQEGLHNLFRLSSKSNAQEHFYSKPRIDFDMLAEHSEGLIVSTGCPSSEISTRFLMGQDAKAYEFASRLKDVFGENLYVEIMDHDMTIELERDLLPKQLKLSKDLGIPLLATNDAHYTHAEDALHHEEMLCSQSGSRMAEPTYDDGGNRFAFQGNEYFLKTPERMNAIFPDRDFPGATKNTLLIAEKAQGIKLDYNPTLMPEPKIPAGFSDKVEYYKHLLNEGFKLRYGNAPKEIQEKALEKIRYEFEVIHSSDFIGYMLTVQEYMSWTREKFSVRNSEGEILALPTGVGRGSVGGSIHAYCLFISEVDPIRWNLIFERFLSAGRGNTFLIEYEDGSTEELIVSTEKTLANGDKRYIHELKVGDEIKF